VRTTLTATQGTILAAIRALTAEQGHAPTLREIADRSGLSSPATVSRHVKILTDDGYLDRTPGIQRSIRLTERAENRAMAPSVHKALTLSVEHANARVHDLEGKLADQRDKTRKARAQSRTLRAAIARVRRLHAPHQTYPWALPDPNGSDHTCINCGHDTDSSADMHPRDDRGDVLCTATGLLPATCAHCADADGNPLPWPCLTSEALGPYA